MRLAGSCSGFPKWQPFALKWEDLCWGEPLPIRHMWNHVFIPHYWGGNEISLYHVFGFSLPLRLVHSFQMGFPVLHHDNGRHASRTALLVSTCLSLKLSWNFRMHPSRVLPARVKFAALMIIKAELIHTITHTLVIIPQTVSHLLWGKWRDSFPHSRVVSDGCKGIRKCLWPSSRYQAWHSSFWMQFYQNRAKRMKNRYYTCLKNRDATRRRNEGACSSFIAVPDAPRLFILLLYRFQGVLYFFLHPLPTLSIDSLLIIYHTGQSAPCITAGAPHDNGWMKLSCL